MYKLYFILVVLLFAFGGINAFPSRNDSIIVPDQTLTYNQVYYGKRLFPNKMDSIEIKQIVDFRVFLYFKMTDTLVVATDNPLIWHNKYRINGYELIKIKKYEFRHMFKPKSYLFNDMFFPLSAIVKSRKDYLFFNREPWDKWDYHFAIGIIGSFKLVKMNRSVEAFCKKFGINIKYLDNVNTLILLHPSMLLGFDGDQFVEMYSNCPEQYLVQINIKYKTISSMKFGSLTWGLDLDWNRYFFGY